MPGLLGNKQSYAKQAVAKHIQSSKYYQIQCLACKLLLGVLLPLQDYWGYHKPNF